MERNKIDIKEFENICGGKSFDKILKTYNLFKRYFTQTYCKKIVIIVQKCAYEASKEVKDDIKKCFDTSKWEKGYIKYSWAQKKFVTEIIFEDGISLEELLLDFERIQLLEEYDFELIDFDQNEGFVTFYCEI